MKNFATSSYVTLDKQLMKKNFNLDSLSLTLNAYNQFNKNMFNEINVCIDQLCYELGYSFNSKRTDAGYPYRIMQYYQTEIQSNRLSISPNNFNNYEMSRKKNIKLIVNEEQKEDVSYVCLSVKEFKTLIDIAKKNKISLHHLVNLFVVMKSYINMDKATDVLRIAYPGKKLLSKILDTSLDKINQYIMLLKDNGLINVFDFTNTEVYVGDRKIEFVYSLGSYTKEQVINYLVGGAI